MELKQIESQVKSHFNETVKIRRHLHMYPELSFQEVHTPAYIAEYLRGLGIEVQEGVGGRGVVGKLIVDESLPTVALRADFDALPIQDLKDTPYKSTVPGVMHACGHDESFCRCFPYLCRRRHLVFPKYNKRNLHQSLMDLLLYTVNRVILLQLR